MPFDAPVTTATCTCSFFDMPGLLLFVTGTMTAADSTRFLLPPCLMDHESSRHVAALLLAFPQGFAPVRRGDAFFGRACLPGDLVRQPFADDHERRKQAERQ